VLEFVRGDVSPGQDIIDPAIGMAVDDVGEDVGEIGELLDVVELAGLCRPSNYAEPGVLSQCFHDLAVTGSS